MTDLIAMYYMNNNKAHAKTIEKRDHTLME